MNGVNTILSFLESANVAIAATSAANKSRQDLSPTPPSHPVVRFIRDHIWKPIPSFRNLSIYHFYSAFASHASQNGSSFKFPDYISHERGLPVTEKIIEAVCAKVDAVHTARTTRSHRKRHVQLPKALEVGAGNGRLAKVLKKALAGQAEVRAIDMSVEPGSTVVRQASMAKLPYGQREFPVVVSSFALDDTNGDQDFQEIHRVLTNDGELIGLFLRRYWWSDFLSYGLEPLLRGSFHLVHGIPILADSMPVKVTVLWLVGVCYMKDIRKFGYASENSMRAVLERNGFEINKLEDIHIHETKKGLNSRPGMLALWVGIRKAGWFVVAKKRP